MKYSHDGKAGSRLARYVAIMLWLGVGVANAAAEIWVVVPNEDAVYQRYVGALKQAFTNGGASAGRDTQLRVVRAPQLSDTLTADAAPRLILAVGSEAAQQAAPLVPASVPLVFTLVPKSAYDALVSREPRLAQRSYAIVLDQPPQRYVRLVKAMLPDAEVIGTLETLASGDQVLALRRAARGHMRVLSSTVEREADLFPALQDMLTSADAFLVLPDPQLFNRKTVQGILLTAFRQRKPLFAYSESYVTAGALAAIFSSVEQIAAQTATTLRCLLDDCAGLRQVQTPREFGVRINHHVARMIGLTVPSEADVLSAIQTMESEQR